MKSFNLIPLKLLCIFLLLGCATMRNADDTPARTFLGPMFEEGQGGQGILAIFRPEGIGLLPDEEKFLDIIQGALNNDFDRFSNLSLFDRRNLENILNVQQETLSGYFSDADFTSIGNLTQSNYLLFGSLTKISASAFNLYLSIADVETGIIIGTFNQSITLRDIINLNVSRAAAEALLPRLGVVFTAEGLEALHTELTAEETAAQNALSLSFEASRRGNLIDALILSYAAEEAGRAPDARRQSEEVFRMMGGTGAAIIADFERRQFWMNNLIDFEEFFRSHPPFELVYTSVPLQNVPTDYERGTVDFEFTVGLRHRGVNVMQRALNDVLRELRQTDYRRNRWGFDYWPRISAESTRENQIITDLFTSFRTFNIEAALMNEHNEIISSINFSMYGQLLLRSRNNIGARSTQERQITITAPVNEITEGMYIRIISINGTDADVSNLNRYLRNSVVTRMPARSRTTIPEGSFVEFPDEREARIAAEIQQRADRDAAAHQRRVREAVERQRRADREAEWDAKPLRNRANLFAAARYNPAAGDSWENALSIEGGIGLGFRNFSIDGRAVFPYHTIGESDLIFGLGAVAGYTFVWNHFLAGVLAGGTWYMQDDETVFLPSLEARFDIAPWGRGLALRLAYKLEFGSSDNGALRETLLRYSHPFGSGSLRFIGSPTAGIVLWF